MATKLLNTTEAAERIMGEDDANAKTLRRFLRDRARQAGQPIPGKGHRWAIPAGEIRALTSSYRLWAKAQAEAAAKRAEAKAVQAASEAEAEAPEAEDSEG